MAGLSFGADGSDDTMYFYGGASFNRDKFKSVRNTAITSGAVTLKLGDMYLWVDATGDLRIHHQSPTGDLSGTVVGTQS